MRQLRKISGRSVGKCSSRTTVAPDRTSCSICARGAERTNVNEMPGDEAAAAPTHDPVGPSRHAIAPTLNTPKSPKRPTPNTIGSASCAVMPISCHSHRKVIRQRRGINQRPEPLKFTLSFALESRRSGSVAAPSNEIDAGAARHRRVKIHSLHEEKAAPPLATEFRAPACPPWRAVPFTNQAASAAHFRYHPAMTIGITGPGRKAPRQNAVVGLIVVAFVIGICLILLDLASDLLVDWLWFSSVGYLQVFLTSIGAKAAVFFAVFAATAVILWLNGFFAVRFSRRHPTQRVAAPAWNPNAPPDLLTL